MPTPETDIEMHLRHLRAQRHHVLAAVDGLDEAQMDVGVLPSGWSLKALIHHLTIDVELWWFGAVVAGDQAVLAEVEAADGWNPPDMPATEIIDHYFEGAGALTRSSWRQASAERWRGGRRALLTTGATWPTSCCTSSQRLPHTPATPTLPQNSSTDASGSSWTESLGVPVAGPHVRGMPACRVGYGDVLTGNDEGMSAPVLSRRLTDLTGAGLLVKSEAPRGKQGRYSLTELGIATLPLMVELAKFGMAVDPSTADQRPDFVRSGTADQLEAWGEGVRSRHLGGA